MPDPHCMWKVAHTQQGYYYRFMGSGKGLSGGFGTSKSAKSCMDRSLGPKSESLYIVQMSLLENSDCGGRMKNHIKTGQLSINSVTGHMVLMQWVHEWSSQGSGRGHGIFPPS